jgi:hypothetical protein
MVKICRKVSFDKIARKDVGAFDGGTSAPDTRPLETGPMKDGITKRDAIGRLQNMTIINESDLYRLIIKSQLPAAQDFECWIMEKVIPAIRKTGSNTMPAAGKPMSQVENIARGLLSVNFMIEQMTKEIEHGCVHHRSVLHVGQTAPAPPGFNRSWMNRRNDLDLAAYDYNPYIHGCFIKRSQPLF